MLVVGRRSQVASRTVTGRLGDRFVVAEEEGRGFERFD